MEALISVVIPIYNTREFLSECINSILNQTYRQIELILVDDGSTDGSGEICDKYTKLDPRVTVVHKENEGLLSARITGARLANGKYIAYVDSDDCIDKEMYMHLVSMAERENADVVSSGFFSTDKNLNIKGQVCHTIEEGFYTDQGMRKVYQKMIFDFNVGNPGVVQAVGTKLFRTVLFREVLQKVDVRVSYGEDASIVYNYLLKAQNIVITNQSYYYYRARSGSMCNSHNMGWEIYRRIYYFYEFMQESLAAYKDEYHLREQLQMYTKLLLELAARNVYGIYYGTSYKIPFDVLKGKQKIILYGAGNVGKSYYRKLKVSNQYEVIEWVDIKAHGKIFLDHRISHPEVIRKLDFDLVLIAVQKEIVAKSIYKYLLENDIKEEKIIWKMPEIDVMLREIEVR